MRFISPPGVHIIDVAARELARGMAELGLPPCEVATAIRYELTGDLSKTDLRRDRLLSLDRDEMRVIQAFYADLGRDPTDVEMETLAQTWSEHCVHKTFRARIDFTWEDADGNVVGLMPHPEDHILTAQNPLGGGGQLGLALFQCMISA